MDTVETTASGSIHIIERDPRLYNDDLAPTRPEDRTWGTYNFAALWIGMAHCIPTYQMASGLVVQGMYWKQALFTILLGNLIVLVPMLLNSHAGTKYGLPFPVICRASFGVFGANAPALLRAIVACGWFGIQTWIGGEALDSLLSSTFHQWESIPGHIAICFLTFWALNVWIIWRGMEAVRWFEGWAAPMVLVVAVILLAYMVYRAHGFGPVLEQPSSFKSTSDFLKHLPIFLTAQIGFWATLSLNMPDFTRYSKNQKSQMWGQVLGLPTTMTFFSAIGVMITSATAIVYGMKIDDPIKLLSMPDFANPVVVLISLVSIGVATLSVNVAANVVSPAFDLANMWPSKIDFKIGGTITALMGIAMCPWKIMASAGNYIFTWLVGYSALLGPIAGIMVADYWILRRCKMHVRELYDVKGRYSYTGGVNYLAVLALIIGILPNAPGFYLEASALNMTPQVTLEAGKGSEVTFAGGKGQVMTIRASGVDGLVPAATVRSAAGTEIPLTMDDGTQTFEGPLPDDGIYTVSVAEKFEKAGKINVVVQRHPSKESDFNRIAKEIYSFAWIVGFLISMGVYTGLMLMFNKENVEADRMLEE